jgi:transcriptional regulator with XRE-family HTH domain
MPIGERLKQLREDMDVSQGVIEKKTGLLRCYISRVENGHTVPALETLQKFADALEVPMYKLFHEGDGPAKPLKLKGTKHRESNGEVKELDKFRRLMLKMNARDQKLVVMLAGKFVRGSESKPSR